MTGRTTGIRLVLLGLLSACVTPSRVECACSCQMPPPALPAWPEYGSIDRMPMTVVPDMLLGLPLTCDAGLCVIPVGAI